MATYTQRFEPVTWQASKSLPCPGGCGKKVRRQRTFSQTLNPWNKNADGQPKTDLEITSELRAQAEEWQQKPEPCTSCSEANV